MRSGGFRDSVNLSKVVVDGDLNLGANNLIATDVTAVKVSTDTLAEKTAATGIAVLNDITVDAAAKLSTDEIAETTALNGVKVSSVLCADHVAENTAGHGVVFDDFQTGITAVGSGTYSGDNTTDKAIAHSLPFVPSCIVIFTHLVGSANTEITVIKGTAAKAQSTYASQSEDFTVTAANATNFYVGGPANRYTSNANTYTYIWVAYQ